MNKVIIISGLLCSIAYSAQNTGIGTTNPTEKLEVAGNIKSTTLNANTGSATDKIVVADASGVLKTIDRSALGSAYTAGAGISITGNTIAATGLEKYTANGKTGWRLISTGTSASDIGIGAVNLANNGSAVGNYSVTLGYLGDASGMASLSGGDSSKASGDYSFAYGVGNRAKGYTSISMGNGSFAETNGAVAIGKSARAYGNNSYSFGEMAYAFSMAQMTVGRYNTSEVTVEPSTFSKNNISVFKVGNGLGGTNTSDAFNVMRNGVTGIDIDNLETSNSNAKLQVNGKVLIGEFGDKDTSNATIANAGTNKAQLDVRGAIASSTLAQAGTTAARPVYADENGVLITGTAPTQTDPIPTNTRGSATANQTVDTGVDTTKFYPVLIKNIYITTMMAAGYNFDSNGATWTVKFSDNGDNNIVSYEILWQRRGQ